MEKMKYFISRVWTENYCAISFEKISEKQSMKFNNLKRKNLYLDQFSGKHYNFIVELHKEWRIEEIVDDVSINAIQVLWEKLPTDNHIGRCIQEEMNYDGDEDDSDENDD